MTMDWFIPAAQAHEKWFLAGQTLKAYPIPEYYYTLNPLTIGTAVVAVAAIAFGVWIDRIFEHSRLYKRLESRIHPLRDYAPGVLAVTTGVLLLWNAYYGNLLAPNFPLPQGFLGGTLKMLEALVGVMLIIGLFVPAAAIALFGFVLALFLLFPAAFPDQTEGLYLAGIACFLFFFAGGRFSLDWFLGKPFLSTPEARKKAYLVLRICLGITLIELAIANKWLHPEAHLALMDSFPKLNPYVIIHWFPGFGWLTRELYVYLLFVTELIIGMYVAFGFLTRFAALFLIPVFLVSAVFLPVGELLGHFPVLGTLFVLFVFGDMYHKHMTSPIPVKDKS